MSADQALAARELGDTGSATMLLAPADREGITLSIARRAVREITRR